MNRSEPAPQGAGSLSVPHDQEASISRYTITVTSNGRSDPDAAIGYNTPLRTFFLQAFLDESGDDLELWLGTSDRKFETIDALHRAARSSGFSYLPLPGDVALLLDAEADRPPHDGPLAGCCDIYDPDSSKQGPRRRIVRRGPFLCPVPPSPSSHSEHITITTLPLHPRQCLARHHGFLHGFIEINADTAGPADPPPLANEADVAEQTWRRRQPIEPRHVACRINAMEMDHVFCLHDVIVASEIDAVQRVL